MHSQQGLKSRRRRARIGLSGFLLRFLLRFLCLSDYLYEDQGQGQVKLKTWSKTFRSGSKCRLLETVNLLLSFTNAAESSDMAKHKNMSIKCPAARKPKHLSDQRLPEHLILKRNGHQLLEAETGFLFPFSISSFILIQSHSPVT